MSHVRFTGRSGSGKSSFGFRKTGPRLTLLCINYVSDNNINLYRRVVFRAVHASALCYLPAVISTRQTLQRQSLPHVNICKNDEIL